MNHKDKCNLTNSDIDHSFTVFQNLIKVAENSLRKQRYIESAIYAQIAAEYACFCHTGMFGSSQLENILSAIGHRTIQDTSQSTKSILRDGAPHHVLHVKTSAKYIGGDTRFVWRWIQNDEGRRHSIALTGQGDDEIPQKLIDSVSHSDGNIYVLDSVSNSPVARAQELYRISQCIDLIILHLYPEDIVPFIAFASKNILPPIIYVNHADHLFSVGVSLGDLVVHLRESGLRLSEERRGIERERMALLPTPLAPISRKQSRSQAKEQLGYSKETILVLSIAREAKYNAIIRPSFVDAILPILEKHKNVALLTIGPTNRDQWVTGYQQTQGRLMALGPRVDTTLFYEAADIYVDSFPFTSVTSLLEAGNYGMPLVSYRPYSERAEVLSADAPGLMNVLIRTTDINQYESQLSRLINDEEMRLKIGEDTKRQIWAIHSGDGWSNSLQELYFKAFSGIQRNVTPRDSDQKFAGELDILLNRLHPHFSLPGFIEKHIRPLPLYRRILLLARILKVDRSFSFGMFLPAWLERQVGGRVRWRHLPGIAAWLDD